MAGEAEVRYDQAVQLSVPLPHAPSFRINVHLTIQATSIVLFLTTSTADAPASGCPLGSFVYAMPNVSAHTILLRVH